MALASLPVSIVRYTNDHQPGWVECQFTDIHGRTYTSGEIKQVYVTNTYVDETTRYPVPGALDCIVVSSVNEVSRITIEESWEGIEEDNHQFEVPTASLTMYSPDAKPGAAADGGGM